MTQLYEGVPALTGSPKAPYLMCSPPLVVWFFYAQTCTRYHSPAFVSPVSRLRAAVLFPLEYFRCHKETAGRFSNVLSRAVAEYET